ncbi:MAG: OmpA family protein [Rhodobacteraceae bacterium]|nr:OmpA family protein [Paracoccaceae bacterium]
MITMAAPALAAPTLSMPPEASRTVEDSRAMDSYAMPIGPWLNGRIETLDAEGEVTRSAWRIRQPGIDTLALLSDLRGQLQAEGFEVLFECKTDQCGGFDFRFGIPVLPEPEMHVDLGDFRFLAARRADDPEPDYVSLLVSRSSDSGYVQMWRVGPALDGQAALAATAPDPAKGAVPATSSALADTLVQKGKIVLSDLSFASGSTTLENGQYSSLAMLADFLKANPDKTVALVGHTDSEGSLDANIALSRKRAQSVLGRLVTVYGVDARQISSDGVGYLSPLASNLTEDGRTKNRRVEALITSTQ